MNNSQKRALVTKLLERAIARELAEEVLAEIAGGVGEGEWTATPEEIVRAAARYEAANRAVRSAIPSEVQSLVGRHDATGECRVTGKVPEGLNWEAYNAAVEERDRARKDYLAISDGKPIYFCRRGGYKFVE